MPAMFLVSLCLAACGGGGAASSTSSSSRPAVGEQEKAGAAAPFVMAGGDNSIPTFGVEASAAERERAEADLRAYLGARAAGDWSSACSGLAAAITEELQKLAPGKDCTPTYRALVGRQTAATRANPLRGRVLALRQRGEGAFALFFGPGHLKYVMPMVKEGGSWRVAQLAPVPYPGAEPASP